MKKPYTKPEVAIENFTLTERIASCDNATIVFDTLQGCQSNVSFSDLVDGWRFLEDRPHAFWADYGCTDIVNDEEVDFGGGNKFCYHTSTGIQVFSS